MARAGTICHGTLGMPLVKCPVRNEVQHCRGGGGVVTDKRTGLAHGSVDYLTFLKMNEAWISEEFNTRDEHV